MKSLNSAAFARFFLCVALVAAPAVRADCVDTVGLTPQEKDFFLRANAVLKSLLRPAPTADKLWSRDSVTEPDFETCKSDKKVGDFTVGVSRKYVWPDPKGNMADSAVTLNLAINADKFDLKEPNYFGAFGSPSPTRSAGLKVHNVVWSVTGSSYGIAAQTETLRASLVRGLEFERMEKLVGRPLPTVLESAALAKKAAPTKLLSSAPTPPESTAVATPAPAQTQKTLNNAASTAPSVANKTPETPAAASPADPVKGLGDSFQKLRGLLGK